MCSIGKFPSQQKLRVLRRQQHWCLLTQRHAIYAVIRGARRLLLHPQPHQQLLLMWHWLALPRINPVLVLGSRMHQCADRSSTDRIWTRGAELAALGKKKKAVGGKDGPHAWSLQSRIHRQMHSWCRPVDKTNKFSFQPAGARRRSISRQTNHWPLTMGQLVVGAVQFGLSSSAQIYGLVAK